MSYELSHMPISPWPLPSIILVSGALGAVSSDSDLRYPLPGGIIYPHF